ncbi:DUF721 domain-containing protein [Candidatus Aerophobetes bacterium]|uniref:DUF721 domain-containing protein n=1 Tax=Aerophobetes bacterium TaxID=2030807 RepID=A0A662D517_UNCAE|nr:MAG: DUF721 domain-containing protein [Candidatus Aerophobetes bacterium]
MNQRDGFPSRIGEVLDRVFEKLGVDKKIKEEKALRLWKEVVGERINKHTHPFSVKKGILFVKVDNSGWLAQLTYLKEGIISKINQREGKKVIKDIYFRLGKVRKVKRRKIRDGSAGKEMKLKEDELEKIREDLEGIKDDSLREVIQRVLIKDKSLKKGQKG